MYRCICAAMLFLLACVSAQGHGPVFGFATPTNSQGEYSCDTAVIARGSGAASQVALRGTVTSFH